MAELQEQNKSTLQLVVMQEGSEKKDASVSPKRYQIQAVESLDSNFPESRFDHITIYNKNRIYIVGGINEKGQKISNNELFYYCLERMVWTKIVTNCQLPQFSVFQPKYGTIIGNRLILLGSPQGNVTTIDIWKLTMDTLEWMPQEQRGECPAYQEGACLLNFQKNQLLYFGGDSNGEYSNLIYLYNIDSKYWHICQGNYQYSLRSRTEASMANLNGKIYLFGGFYKGVEGLQALNDLYEIIIKPAFKSNPATATIIKISTSTTPPAMGAAFMFQVNGKDLCLLGGETPTENQEIVWHFSTELCDWTEVDIMNDVNFNSQGSGWVQQKSNLWKFGGLKESQNSEVVNVRGDFVNISFNWQKYYLTTLEKKRKNLKNRKYSPACKICYQIRNSFFCPVISFSSDDIEQFAQMIEFPFAAFGLLLDNCVAQASSSIIVKIDKTSSEDKYFIRIDDNARHPWSDDELEAALLTLGQSVTHILVGCDKKIKKDIVRKNNLLQFGRNIKIGSLRLGKSFLYISSLNKKVRVGYCYQAETSVQSQYLVHFYSYDLTTKELTLPSMAESKKIIEQKYHKLIKEVLESKQYVNTLFIFDTILNDPKDAVNIDLQGNDVYFGSSSDLETLRELGYNIEDSIDVSLRAYLSALYLADATLEITFELCKMMPTYVGIQNVLQKMDKVARSGSAIELKGIFENQYDFKKAEFYILKDMKKSFTFFNNGLLLYYHNRLISRFKPELGTLVEKLITDTSGLYNCIPLFGYAELPEGVDCNLFKTNFCYEIMLESLFSRFKMIEENFKKRIPTIETSIPKEALKRRQKKPEQAVQPIKQLPWKLRGSRDPQLEGKVEGEDFSMKSRKKRYTEQYDSSYEAAIKFPDSEERRNKYVNEDRRKRHLLVCKKPDQSERGSSLQEDEQYNWMK